MKNILISTLCLASFAAASASAQIVWDANATTGVPNFSAAGTVKTWTFDGGANGKGVRLRPAPVGTGLSYLYIPVTAANATVFGCIAIRAHDSNNLGLIRAEFIRQPRVAAGAAVVLGAVSTNDTGFQYQQAPFAAHVINYPLSTYYVRVTFRTGLTVPADLTAYDVSLLSYCQTFLPSAGEGESTN